MSADIYGGITVDLNDAPIRTEYDRSYDGKPLARLVIGEDNASIAITVSNSSPETVAQLAEAAAQLAAWTQRQTLRKVA
ncbi:hypothetical protein JL475_00095 [Streptomyces sp. M2CJ-2]|uniref:hypothetical protein n=1 Tax=Streptomyces sp. M2CJ-2 TaxID=2803948 RepID=UPI0019205D5B|nr:hypothetical protein [Streptomyces sp. M2CJ-2]MBL3664445.1 hypothetical protein [Streptomyces sp. M2CJ-2]